jgi:hypothetical protein
LSQLSILSSERSTLTHQLWFLNFHISAPSFLLSMLNDKLLTFRSKCPTHQNGQLRCTLIWKLSVTALSRMTILSAPSGEIVWLAIPQTWHGGNATTSSFIVQTSITRRSGYLERLYCMIIFECLNLSDYIKYFIIFIILEWLKSSSLSDYIWAIRYITTQYKHSRESVKKITRHSTLVETTYPFLFWRTRQPEHIILYARPNKCGMNKYPIEH